MDTINCLEARRQITTDPVRIADAVREHLDGCPSCSAYARSLVSSEEQLRRALEIPVPETLGARIRVRQTMDDARASDFESALAAAIEVPVPEGLAQRILDRTALERARTRKRRKFLQFSMAASIAVAVAVGSILTLRPDVSVNEEPLLSAVMAHNRYHAPTLGHPVPPELISPVLHMVGLEMERPTRRAIHSATACDVRDKQALHLVMSGAQGPVNVYVMPDEPMERVITGQGEGWHGLVVPVRHGSMAVVGHPKEDLQPFARDVRGSLRWRL